MNNLPEALEIKEATVEDWTHRHTEKGLKMHFSVRGKLTPELASALGCKFVYEGDVDGVSLSHEFKETEIFMPSPAGDGTGCGFFPDVVYKFKVAKQDAGFSVQFLVHVSTRIEELHEILKGYDGAGGLEIQLRSRQGELFDGGTRVEMGPDGQEPVSANLTGEALERHEAVASGKVKAIRK